MCVTFSAFWLRHLTCSATETSYNNIFWRSTALERCAVTCIIRWYNVLSVRVDVLCKLETLKFVIRVKVAYKYISNKPPFVVEAQNADIITKNTGGWAGFSTDGVCRLTLHLVAAVGWHQLPDQHWVDGNRITITITNQSQEVSIFPSGDYKVAMNRRESMTITRHK